MPTDQEHLEKAGIQDTGDVQQQTPESTPTQTPAADTKAPATPAEMFELNGNKFPVDTPFKLNHGGKILNVPYSTLANTYRQWQHQQDKWNNEYKPKITEFEKLRPDFDKYKGFYDKYGKLQEWSEANPKEWDSLYQLWQNKDKHLLNAQVQPTQGTTNPNLDPVLQKLAQYEEKFGKYDQVLSKYEQQEKDALEAKDTEFVKKEITDFKTEFPEINLDERDPDGVALWAKIIQWGMTKGYQEFTPAAHIYLKERIADTYQSRTRSEVMKTQKVDYAQGVVKRSATPITGQVDNTKPLDVKKMSYSDIATAFKEGRLGATG